MIRDQFRFIYGPYPIIHVSLSIPAQLYCKIKRFSFWIHLNVRTSFVIVVILSWLTISQYIATNHAYDSIVVFGGVQPKMYPFLSFSGT